MTGEIGSIHGAPSIASGAAAVLEEIETSDPSDAFSPLQKYGISARFTFSNSCWEKSIFLIKRCNTSMCIVLRQPLNAQNGVIIHSDLLLDHLKENYPEIILHFFYNKSADGF